MICLDGDKVKPDGSDSMTFSLPEIRLALDESGVCPVFVFEHRSFSQGG